MIFAFSIHDSRFTTHGLSRLTIYESPIEPQFLGRQPTPAESPAQPLQSKLAILTQPRPVQFVHLTDPHLTSLDGLRPGPLALKRWMSWLSWQRRRRGVHLPARLDALIRALRRREPDAWAVTGDLCQIGLDAEIEQARAWLDALDTPERVLLVPGNHDIFAPDSVETARRQWREWMACDDHGQHSPAVRRIGPVSLIGVDSAVVTAPGSATGRVGNDGLERLQHVLEQEQGRFRVVLIHHPPLPGVCSKRKALNDAPELTRLLDQTGAGLVLHGHLHHNQDWTRSSGTRIYCTASASSATAAAARLFRITPEGGQFELEMELIELNSDGGEQVVERQRWESIG